MGTTVKQSYKGPASNKIKVRSNFPRRKLTVSGPIGRNVTIKIRTKKSDGKPIVSKSKDNIIKIGTKKTNYKLKVEKV